MMYRDKVEIDGRPERANVWQVSSGSRWASGGTIDEAVIIVSLPPKTAGLSTSNVVRWHDHNYAIQGIPSPIYALGRLDHWEISAKWTTGAG